MSIDPFDPVTEAESESAPAAAAEAEAGAAPEARAPLAYIGPFEREPWPERLTARVVEPGPDARIHGYHVSGDLARHHGMVDVLWLALTGELPTDAERAALDAATVLLAPVHVGQAPAHAAFLSRIAGATPGATVAIAAVGLGELARHERELLAPWITWLERNDGPVPAVACAPIESAEAAAGQRWLDSKMRLWFGAGRGLPPGALTRVACGYALLARLGLRGPLAIETVTVWARLPAIAAEAAHAGAGAVRQYPARLPDYQYVDGQGIAS